MRRSRRYSTRPPRVFLSYRRDDTGGYAQQLYQPLAEAFGDDRVFMDTQKRRPGEDFWTLIDTKLRRSDCVLAVIGPDWLGEGENRLLDEKDFVRREIELALATEKRLIPVLVGGTEMPSEETLPASLRPLLRREAFTIHQGEFPGDVADLIALLDDRVISRALLGCLIAILLLTASSGLRVADPLNVMASDWTMGIGDTIAPTRLRDDIVVVAIDPASEAALGPFGAAWRQYHARLVDIVSALHAKTIAFDITFAASSDFDRAFADAITLAHTRGTKVFAATASPEGQPLVAPGLATAFDGTGVAMVGHQLGRTSTAVIALHRGAPNASPDTLPSLALLAAYQFGQVRFPDVSPESFWDQLGSSQIEIGLPRGGTDTRIHAWLEHIVQKQGSVAVSVGDDVAHLMLRLSPLAALRSRQLSYKDVLDPTPAVQAEFTNKIVLVGALNEADVYDTTLGFTPERRYGIELHADAVSDLLDATAPRPIGRTWAMIATAVMGALGWHLRKRGGRAASPLAIVAVAATLVAIAVTAYTFSPFLVDVPLPLIAFLVAYLAAGRPLRLA
jgi:CHASE2 domain-containing sensor protein